MNKIYLALVGLLYACVISNRSAARDRKSYFFIADMLSNVDSVQEVFMGQSFPLEDFEIWKEYHAYSPVEPLMKGESARAYLLKNGYATSVASKPKGINDHNYQSFAKANNLGTWSNKPYSLATVIINAKQYFQVSGYDAKNKLVTIQLLRPVGKKFEIMNLKIWHKYPNRAVLLPPGKRFRIFLLENGFAELAGQTTLIEDQQAQQRAITSNSGLWAERHAGKEQSGVASNHINTVSGTTKTKDIARSKNTPVLPKTTDAEDPINKFRYDVLMVIVGAVIVFLGALGRKSLYKLYRKIFFPTRKIFLIGPSGAGKTSLFLRLTKKGIKKEHLEGLSRTSQSKNNAAKETVDIGDKKVVPIIYDTVGGTDIVIPDEISKHGKDIVILVLAISPISGYNYEREKTYITRMLLTLGKMKTKPKKLVLFINKFDQVSSRPYFVEQSDPAKEVLLRVFKYQIDLISAFCKEEDIIFLVPLFHSTYDMFDDGDFCSKVINKNK